MSSEADHTDEVQAHFPTPSGAHIRLRGEREEDHAYVEVVKATIMRSNGRPKSDDATVVTLYEGDPVTANALYNDTIEPWMKEELEAAREIMFEAEEQGDTITYMAQKEYVKELEADLS